MRAAFLCLVMTGVFVSTATVAAQTAGSFSPTGQMTAPRSLHTATLLPNGNVLITGGTQRNGSSLASAELYHPDSGTFTETGGMTVARRLHTSTLLPDGRVLIAGGFAEGNSLLTSAELYDPSTGTFTSTGDMLNPRAAHTAILLSSGKVLMVGGAGIAGFPAVAPAEIYDPNSKTFTATGEYVARGSCDFCAPAVLLPDGNVLFPGQYPAQLYDPITSSFSRTGMMLDDQSAATLLMNGKVLFAGGVAIGRLATAEAYEPATYSFSSTGSMMSKRVWHTLTSLPDGTVLAAGGETEGCAGFSCSFAGSVTTAELYDPSTGTFFPTGIMAEARETHTATVLNDGRVLLAGGVSYGGIGIFRGPLAGAELYTSDVLVPSPVLISLPGNDRRQGAIFHARSSHLAASDDPAVAGEMVDISCKGLPEKSVIPPQVVIGGRSAVVISFGEAPNEPGVRRIRVIVPDGVTAGPAAPVRLTYMDRSTNEVTMAVR